MKGWGESTVRGGLHSRNMGLVRRQEGSILFLYSIVCFCFCFHLTQFFGDPNAAMVFGAGSGSSWPER